MKKRLLLVAYPLLPVSEASAGGAEQVLWTLERELTLRGWDTEVAACAGSVVSGELLATGDVPKEMDDFIRREREHAERVISACGRESFALVLDHSGHFFRHAALVEGNVLATLHLPRELYGDGAFEGLAENVYFNCVSESQKKDFSDVPRMLGVVRNGIALERFPMGRARSDYFLWLGRVCPEKAPHLAIEAAKLAGVPIVVAGQVYPFQWHNQYWEQKVKPLLDGERVRWVELPSFAQKTKLLQEARAVLISSQVAETTSLVALEAMASGTPVIAFDAGALTEVVPKETGFIVHGVQEMALACRVVSRIRSQACREWVERKYSAKAMAEGYETLITNLEEQRRWELRRGE